MVNFIFERIFKWCILGFIVLATTVTSSAAEYYVSTTGDDATGNGSLLNPYQTIQYVLDNVAESGETITLRGGTYSEDVRIRNANMTIRSRSGEWGIIQSVLDDEDRAIAVHFDVDSDGSRLERVEVTGGYYYGIKFETRWDWGDPSDRSGASNIIIEDCKIHDTGNACIKVTPGCDDITIRRCEIYNSGRNEPDSAEAIDNVNGDRMLVQQCHIHDITDTGLYAKGGTIGTRIERCLVENCGGAGILLGFDTSPEFFDLAVNPDYYENIDGEVNNCIVVNTQYAGIGLYAAKNGKVYNNTLVDVAQDAHSGLYFGITFQDWDPEAGRPPSLNPTLRNNIVVQSARSNSTMMEIRYSDELGGLSALTGMPTMSNNRYYVKNGSSYFEDNRPGSTFSGGLPQWKTHISGDTATTEGDPEFVDSSSRDYHLSSASPCIDTGTSNGAPNTDYDGVTRPQGQGYDVGAYEYMVKYIEKNITFIAGDFYTDGHYDLAGLNTSDELFYTTNLNTWNQIPGTLKSLSVGDFNNDGKDDLAGLNSAGLIYYTTDLSTWIQVPGTLASLAVGDFNGDGKVDLAGLDASNYIYYTTNLTTWNQVPGSIEKLVTGDFNNDGKDDLAGLNSAGLIYYTTDLSSWSQVPGTLKDLVVGDFNNDNFDDLSGLNAQGHIYYTTNLSSWNQVPGTISKLLSADLNGDGASDLAGLNALDQIYYTTNLRTWNQVPGTLANLITGDFDGTGGDDLAGLNDSGSIFYTTNLSSWNQIPGKLAPY